MKRILFLILGYYLCVQAGLGALAGFGEPANLALYWIVSAGAGWLGYTLIQKARAMKSTKQLDAPETQPLPKP